MPDTVIVETAFGQVRGRRNDAVLSFKGIPYAAPPTGELRWRRPEPPQPWTGIRDALAFGAAAPQESTPLMRVGDQSEDCLFLNVWTPGTDGRRPVVVWIHGGGFLIGSSAQREYSGRRLAARGDVVVVSINYRLGALGFAAFDDASGLREATDTNLGIRDQIAALEWVRDNVAAFGGDPDNVTVFGESAGGMSVGTLLATSACGRLFHKAIAQSGASFHCTSLEDAGKVAARLLQQLEVGRGDTSRLRNASFADVLKAQRKCVGLSVRCGPWQLPMLGMNFLPVFGDDVLPRTPQAAIEAGDASGVSLLTGTTLEEWRLFSTIARMAPPQQRGAMVPGTVSEAELPEFYEQRVPGHGAALLQGYRQLAGDAADPGTLEQWLETDRMFFVPGTRMATAQAKHRRDTFMYRFDWRSPMFGAAHAIDIPFVFGGVDEPFGKMFTGGGEAAAALAERVQAAWIAFARTGSPAVDALPDWPPFDGAARATMVFDADCRLETQPLESRLRLWDRI